jgi:hypothetical protein
MDHRGGDDWKGKGEGMSARFLRQLERGAGERGLCAWVGYGSLSDRIDTGHALPRGQSYIRYAMARRRELSYDTPVFLCERFQGAREHEHA